MKDQLLFEIKQESKNEYIIFAPLNRQLTVEEFYEDDVLRNATVDYEFDHGCGEYNLEELTISEQHSAMVEHYYPYYMRHQDRIHKTYNIFMLPNGKHVSLVYETPFN